MPQLIPPVPIEVEDYSDSPWVQFFESLRKFLNSPPIYQNNVDPSLADVPNGSWSVWRNTTSGVVKIWANDGGVLKSVTLT